MNRRSLAFPLIALSIAGALWWSEQSSDAGSGSLPTESLTRDLDVGQRSTTEVVRAQEAPPLREQTAATSGVSMVAAGHRAAITIRLVDRNGLDIEAAQMGMWIASEDEEREQLSSLPEEWTREGVHGGYGSAGSKGARIPFDGRAGTAALPNVEPPVTLFAYLPDRGLHGVLELGPGASGEQRLVLDTSTWLTVRVVSASGSAVQGAYVTLRAGAVGGAEGEALVGAYTDEEGRCELGLSGPGMVLREAPLTLDVRSQFGPQTSIPVEREALSLHGEHRMVVPDTGEIVLTCDPAFETVGNQPIDVWLRGSDDEGFAEGRLRIEPGTEHRLRDVALDEVFELRYALNGTIGRMTWEHQVEPLPGFSFRGPTAAFPVATVKLEGVPEHLLLKGRIQGLPDALLGLDPEVARELRVWRPPLGDSMKRYRPTLIELGPEGEFALLDTGGSAEERSTTRIVLAAGTGPDSVWAAVELPGSGELGLHTGEHDLGLLDMQPARLLLDGVILDPSGAPAGGATLKVVGPEGVLQDVRTDAEGRFELWVPDLDGKWTAVMRWHSEKWGWISQPVDRDAFGQRGVQLQLESP